MNKKTKKVNKKDVNKAVRAILTIVLLGLALAYVAYNYRAFGFALLEPRRAEKAAEFLYKEGANTYDKTLSTVLNPLAQ